MTKLNTQVNNYFSASSNKTVAYAHKIKKTNPEMKKASCYAGPFINPLLLGATTLLIISPNILPKDTICILHL